MRALVLDLRDNPGGLLKSAVEVSDLFLDEGPIVSTKDRNGDGEEATTPRRTGTLLEPAAEQPMAVLVNKIQRQRQRDRRRRPCRTTTGR